MQQGLYKEIKTQLEIFPTDSHNSDGLYSYPIKSLKEQQPELDEDILLLEESEPSELCPLLSHQQELSSLEDPEDPDHTQILNVKKQWIQRG